MDNVNAVEDVSRLDTDLPPGLGEMFINSTDTLRHREINQKIPETWNDRPPLFAIGPPSQKRSFLWRKPQSEEDVARTVQEDPNLLKGVSVHSTCVFRGSNSFYRMKILTIFIADAADAAYLIILQSNCFLIEIER